MGQEEICKIHWGKIIDTLESERKGLIRNTIIDRKPVKISNQMGNMIKFRFTIDKPCCFVLEELKRI